MVLSCAYISAGAEEEAGPELRHDIFKIVFMNCKTRSSRQGSSTTAEA